MKLRTAAHVSNSMPPKLSAARLPRQTTARSVLAWLCILLILVTGCIHLLHQHPAGDDAASAACGLCAVAHLSVLPVPVLEQPVVAYAFTSFDPESIQAPPPRFFHPSLYVRPPPALTTLA